MNSILKWSFFIALLGTSISAFAASDRGKADKETNANTARSEVPAARSTVGRENSNQDKNIDPSCSCSSCPSEQKIKEQEKRWLHDLQGIFG